MFLKSRWMTCLLGLLIVLALAAIAWRVHKRYHVPGPLDGVNFGFCDFHNGVYWPSLAVTEGVSPYGEVYAKQYPVPRASPPFTPSIFALHLPLAWLPMEWGEWFYYLWNAILIGILAYFSILGLGRTSGLNLWLAVVLMTVVSRPGYGTLFSGYFTLELVLGTLIALHWGDRPWVGGLGFALAAGKPTYAIPLAIVMIARGHWRSLVLGGLIVGGLSLAVWAWLLPGKPWDYLLTDIRYGQAQHLADRWEMPEFSWTRVDLVAIVAKWMKWNPSDWIQLLWMLVMIPFPAWLIYRLRSVPGTTSMGSVTSTLALLTLQVTLYRHYYDMLMLVVPLVAVVLSQDSQWKRIGYGERLLIGACLFGAIFNYLSTKMFLDRFEPERWLHAAVTSASGVGLVIAMLLVMHAAWRVSREPAPAAAETPSLQNR